MSRLTHARLLDALRYEPSTGEFRWLYQSSTWINVGDLAGCVHSLGYVVIGVDNETFRAHRLAWFYVHGEWPSKSLDHINGDRADNRICNLRLASAAENNQNRRGAPKNSLTGVLGVRRNTNGAGFTARISVDRARLYLGTFPTEQEAYDAYLAAKRTHHPMGTL